LTRGTARKIVADANDEGRTEMTGVLEPRARLLEDTRRLAETLAELVRVVHFLDRDRARAHGLSVGQAQALEGVARAGGLTVNELAAHLYVDKSTASRIAEALVDAEYLARGGRPGDARVVRLVANERGRALSAALRADTERDYAGLLEDAFPQGRAETQGTLAGLVRCLAAGVEVSGGACRAVK
jgi:DNA-binding MarR family transcriptional regulator